MKKKTPKSKENGGSGGGRGRERLVGEGEGESDYKEQEEPSLQILSRKKYKKSDDAVKWTNSAKSTSTQRTSMPPQSPEQRPQH